MLTVLICDDDAMSRHLMKRAVNKAFSCRVLEATDGLEALDALQDQPVDLVVTDLAMPIVGGLQVLRSMRANPSLQAIPVVIISGNNETSTVLEAIRLHAEDVVAKPIDLDFLTARLTRLAQAMGDHRAGARRRTEVALEQDATALLVDGDMEYRQFVTSIIGGRCDINDVDSGSRALRACLKQPPDVLFVGTELGLLEPVDLVKQVRAIRSKAIRIVGLPLKAEAQAARDSGLYDEVLVRTYDVVKFGEEINRLLRPLQPFELMTERVPDIRTRMLRAVEQVFGRMLKTDVEPLTGATEAGERSSASITLSTAQFVTTLRIRYSLETGRHLAEAFLGSDATGLSDEDVASVGGELANVLAGRLHAAFEERRVESSLGLPVLGTEPEGAQTADAQNDENGFDQYFRAVDRPIMFQLDLTVEATTALTPAATVDEESGVAMLRAEP